MEIYFKMWLDIVANSLREYLVYAGIAFMIFYVLFTGFFHRRKIQSNFPGFKHYRRDFIYSMITITIFATIALLVFDILKTHPYSLGS